MNTFSANGKVPLQDLAGTSITATSFTAWLHKIPTKHLERIPTEKV